MKQNPKVQQQTFSPQSNSQSIEKRSKIKNIPIFVMVIVTILSLSLAGFLYFQNTRLRKQILEDKYVLEPTMTSVPALLQVTDRALLEKLASEHENVEIVESEMKIDGSNKYGEIFSTESFIVHYPGERKVYGDYSFHLCPLGVCQDDEMSVYLEEKDVADWLLNPQRPVSLWLDTKYSIKLYPNVVFKQYKGVGYQIISGTERDPQEKNIAVAFVTSKGLLYGYLDFNNELHHNIWSSVELK